MTCTDELPPFETRLLADLTDVVAERRGSVPVRRSRKRIRWAVATCGVTGIAVAAALAPGMSTSTGAPAYAIRELPGGVIEIDWEADLADLDAGAAAQLAAEAREFGLDLEVVPVPASPSVVGDASSYFVPLDGVAPGFEEGRGTTVFRIDPSQFVGTVRIDVPVAAEPGERYEMTASVFEEGEALAGLHCAVSSPLRTEDVLPHLDELGLVATWSVWDEIVDPYSYKGRDVAVPPAGEIESGRPIDDRTVHFYVVAEGVPRLESDPPAEVALGPCSDDLAARWG